MINTHPFGYKDYNDVLHNGVQYTLDEVKNVKDGDKVILLTMTDSDDDYSLENRLFEIEVDSVNSDGFNAGGYWVDFSEYTGEYFLILHPKDYKVSTVNTDNYTPTEEELEAVRPTVIGAYKPQDKFLEFIGVNYNINFLAKEATIEGNQLSGLDYDGITFKMTICDEGTVNFDEVDTNHTTPEQRGRLIDIISEKTLGPARSRWIVRELKFTSVHKVAGKYIPLYLCVEHERPMDTLKSLFDDDDTPEISDEQSSKLDALMSMFDDDSDTAVEVEEEIEVEVVEEVSTYQTTIEASFAKMKKEKVDELKNRLETKNRDIVKFEQDIKQSEKKIEDAKKEYKLIEDRLETLQPNEPFTGYYFNVSERLNEKVQLEDSIAELIRSKVSKVKSINTDAFMKLFEDGEYHVRLGVKKEDGTMEEFTEYESLTDDVKKLLRNVGLTLTVDQPGTGSSVEEALKNTKSKLVYFGEMGWGDIVQKMIKNGFAQEGEFDKMCGSNSYKTETSEDEQSGENLIKKFNEATVGPDGSMSWEDDGDDDWGDDEEEMFGEFKDDDFVFSIYEQEGAVNDMADPKYAFSVTPVSYWKSDGCCYDQHLEFLLRKRFPMIKALGDAFEELQESEFCIWDEKNGSYWNFDQIIDLLCKSGLKPSTSYQKWCSDKDLGTYIDTINKLGHQNSLIA